MPSRNANCCPAIWSWRRVLRWKSRLWDCRDSEGHERCRATTDSHSPMGREYRRNAGGDPVKLRIASWHEHVRRVFEEGAARQRVYRRLTPGDE